jgi:hypothetical protein
MDKGREKKKIRGRDRETRKRRLPIVFLLFEMSIKHHSQFFNSFNPRAY